MKRTSGFFVPEDHLSFKSPQPPLAHLLAPHPMRGNNRSTHGEMSIPGFLCARRGEKKSAGQLPGLQPFPVGRPASGAMLNAKGGLHSSPASLRNIVSARLRRRGRKVLLGTNIGQLGEDGVVMGNLSPQVFPTWNLMHITRTGFTHVESIEKGKDPKSSQSPPYPVPEIQ